MNKKKPTKKRAVKKVTKSTAKTRLVTKASAKVGRAKTPKALRSPKSNDRIGILGGAFNPIHIGHLNSALTVKQKLNLDRVLLMPANVPPHRQVVGTSAQDRLAMVQVAAKAYAPELEASAIEIRRGGTSYTFETLAELNKIFKPENIFFIMGADAFQEFSAWREFEKLITLANFVVTTRPGAEAPLALSELPEGVARHVKNIKEELVILDTGRTVTGVELEDIDVSATEIRKRLRNNQNVKDLLPPAVADYIEKNNLYKRTSPLVSNYRDFALLCGRRVLDKKGLSLKIYDMSAKNSYADFSVICSATSARHAAAVAEGILESVREDFGLSPISVEGLQQGQWVLLDYGAVVVHVFQDYMRTQYRLEDLWRDCPQIQNEIKEALSVVSGQASELRNT